MTAGALPPMAFGQNAVVAVSLRACFGCVLIPALLAVATACGSGAPQSSTGPTGSVVVFLGPGLQAGMRDEVSVFEQAYPGANVTLNAAEGHLMLGRLTSGAPCDVLALAADGLAEAERQSLVASPPRPFARDTLEIVVAHGNPNGIHGVSDLARPGLRVALVSAATPIGAAIKRVLDRAAVKIPNPTMLDEESAAFSAVLLGQADAAIVHPTDIINAAPADAAKITGADNETITYSISVTKRPPNPQAARAFVAQILSPPGQQRLRRLGYLPT